jgi:F-type H+-transporting ATPase subunit a
LRYLASANLPIGDHLTVTVGGLTFNIDDIIASAVAGLIIIGLGLYMRAKVTAGVPGKLQLAFETITGAVSGQVESTIGPQGVFIVPLAVVLFVYILIANWLELIPTEWGAHHQLLPAPTGDVNQTYALALVVFILIHVSSIRARGFKGYIRHYFQPYKVLFPINVIEEIAKPFTMSLRLFGNIFAGGLLLLIFAGLFPWNWIIAVPLGDVIWKLFDGLFVGPIQAFIFSLLTILYVGAAVSDGH